MRIGSIIEAQQPDIYKQLNEKYKQNKKKKDRRGQNLSFSDVMDLMKHDSYKRHNGALRQK